MCSVTCPPSWGRVGRGTQSNLIAQKKTNDFFKNKTWKFSAIKDQENTKSSTKGSSQIILKCYFIRRSWRQTIDNESHHENCSCDIRLENYDENASNFEINQLVRSLESISSPRSQKLREQSNTLKTFNKETLQDDEGRWWSQVGFYVSHLLTFVVWRENNLSWRWKLENPNASPNNKVQSWLGRRLV